MVCGWIRSGALGLQLFSCEWFISDAVIGVGRTTISGSAVTGFLLTLDGADENDIAGVTLSLSIPENTVSTQSEGFQAIKAMYR